MDGAQLKPTNHSDIISNILHIGIRSCHAAQAKATPWLTWPVPEDFLLLLLHRTINPSKRNTWRSVGFFPKAVSLWRSPSVRWERKPESNECFCLNINQNHGVPWKRYERAKERSKWQMCYNQKGWEKHLKEWLSKRDISKGEHEWKKTHLREHE